MKKRSLKIMSVVLAGVMTTGMILGGCSAGGDKENLRRIMKRKRE